jgi:hypothetical protein
MEPRRLLPFPEETTTVPYPEPAYFSAHIYTKFS